MGLLRFGLLAVLLSSLTLVACSAPSKVQPREFEYTGTWKGTLVDAVHGDGTITTTIDQDEFNISGTWYSTFGEDGALQNGGTLAGQIFVGQDTDLVDALLKPQVSSLCTYKMTLTRTDDRLNGTYDSASGPDCHAGTVRMTKQP